jgi:beta-1,4-N-acetylglucosaminyltransferase
MLMLLEQLDKAHYSPRCYVVAATDRMSAAKALTKEQAWGGGCGGKARIGLETGPKLGARRTSRRPRRGWCAWAGWLGRAAATHPSLHPPRQGQDVSVEVIPRSREVGQSYATSVGTTLYSLAFAAWMVLRQRPGLVRRAGEGGAAV